MNQPECILPGVVFLDQEQARWIRGDLHLLYDILVVNATDCSWLLCAWQYCSTDPLDPKQNMVKCNGAFYFKGGQIVFPLAHSEFNEAANKYLNEQMGTSHIILFGSDRVQ